MRTEGVREGVRSAAGQRVLAENLESGGPDQHPPLRLRSAVQTLADSRARSACKRAGPPAHAADQGHGPEEEQEHPGNLASRGRGATPQAETAAWLPLPARSRTDRHVSRAKPMPAVPQQQRRGRTPHCGRHAPARTASQPASGTLMLRNAAETCRGPSWRRDDRPHKWRRRCPSAADQGRRTAGRSMPSRQPPRRRQPRAAAAPPPASTSQPPVHPNRTPYAARVYSPVKLSRQPRSDVRGLIDSSVESRADPEERAAPDDQSAGCRGRQRDHGMDRSSPEEAYQSWCDSQSPASSTAPN